MGELTIAVLQVGQCHHRSARGPRGNDVEQYDECRHLRYTHGISWIQLGNVHHE